MLRDDLWWARPLGLDVLFFNLSPSKAKKMGNCIIGRMLFSFTYSTPELIA